jgi:hypothetical protein
MRRLTATERGYGGAHRRARELVAREVELGEASCCECGRPIDPKSKWHLAHDHQNGGYKGVAHPGCNTKERNKRVARQRFRKRARPRYSRTW